MNTSAFAIQIVTFYSSYISPFLYKLNDIFIIIILNNIQHLSSAQLIHDAKINHILAKVKIIT